MLSTIKTYFKNLEESFWDSFESQLFISSLVSALILGTGFWFIYKPTYVFNQECQSSLALIQNSTTLEIAQKYLDLTLPKCQKFASKNNWSFWYDNLKAQQEILNLIEPKDSEIKKQQTLNLVKANLEKEADWRN